jgi:hypothetical protein
MPSWQNGARMKKSPPKSARNLRRARDRELAKDVRERERLARLVTGGSPGRPIEVASASVIEVQARSTPCPLCGGELRIEEHSARRFEEGMLRVVSVRCFRCGAPRELFFRIAAGAS